MYEATKSEREVLKNTYNYNSNTINLLDIESDKVRRGISIDIAVAADVCAYQSVLQSIRKTQKKWWQFWKSL